MNKILRKLKNSSKNVKFSELQLLLKQFGFVAVRHPGSHEIYQHPDFPALFINIQEVNGEAKPSQVKQVIDIIDELVEGLNN